MAKWSLMVINRSAMTGIQLTPYISLHWIKIHRSTKQYTVLHGKLVEYNVKLHLVQLFSVFARPLQLSLSNGGKR